MPFQIRHIESGDIVKMRSGKSIWVKASHAKASWLTSGLKFTDRQKYSYNPIGARYEHGRKFWKFDSQDQFELVEVEDTSIQVKQLKRAMELLTQAQYQLHDAAYTLLAEIEEFVGEQKNAV